MATVCERCGVEGQQHILIEGDCVLNHPDHGPAEIGTLCRRHYHWIDSTLVQLEELFALRDDVLLPGPGSGERHGNSIHSPAPGRLGIMALTDSRAKTPIDLDEDDIPDLPGSLHSWAQMVAEERKAELDGTVTGSIRLLRKERHYIASQDWVTEYAFEITALHRALSSAVGDTMWPRPIGKCPNCTSKLYNTIGIDIVTCGRCKTSWEGVHLVRLRLVLEQEA